MGFKVPVKGQSVGTGSSYDPLAAGSYRASIFDISVEEYGPKTNNAGKSYAKVQFRIADGQEGANRRLFENIPLFTQWGPTAKNPDGSDAFTFFGFFSAVLGVKEKDFRKTVTEALEKAQVAAEKSGKDDTEFELPIPDPDTLLGKELTLVVKIVDDDYKFKQELLTDPEAKQADFKKNTVSAFKPAGAGGSQGVDSAKEKFITL